MKLKTLVDNLSLEQYRIFDFVVYHYGKKYNFLPTKDQLLTFVDYLKETTECEDRYIGTEAQPLYCLEIEGCIIDGEDYTWVLQDYLSDHEKKLDNILAV